MNQEDYEERCKARKRMHLRYLKELWYSAKNLPQFAGFGAPHIDEEVRTTWGDWNTQDKPYLIPFNVLPETKPQKDPEEISKWGRDVVTKARNTPGFDECVASRLSDKNLARLIWAQWENLDGTNKLKKIIAHLMETKYE